MAKKKKKLNAQQIQALNFQITESYKKARTSLVYSIIKKGCRKVIITSSFKSEGKTTTACNIAIALSQQVNTRVLLIDCDLRRPTVHTTLGIESGKGLANYLNNECSLADVIDKTDYEGLDAITYGAIPPNPSELLASEEMGEMIKELEKEYDFILFDTPPVNMVFDVVPLIGLSDGVVIVAKHNETTYPELNKAVESLKINNGKILGVIINYVPTLETTKGGYYFDRRKKGRTYETYGVY